MEPWKIALIKINNSTHIMMIMIIIWDSMAKKILEILGINNKIIVIILVIIKIHNN